MKRWLLLFGLLGAGAAIAQAPNEIWGLVYNLVAPVLNDKQTVQWQGSSSGQLRVDGLTPAAPCGDGTIDLSTGCTQPMLGVL